MNIIKNVEGKKLIINVAGRLDTTTAPELEKSIAESIDEIDEMVIDFKELDYISSAGLRVLLSTQKSMAKKSGLSILNVNDTIKEVFEITGFDSILTIK